MRARRSRIRASDFASRPRRPARLFPAFGFLMRKVSTPMLRFAVIFAILALVAGVLGFGNMAGDFAYIAKILLFVFLILFVVALVLGRGSGPAV